MIGHWLAWLPVVPTQGPHAAPQATSAPVPATLPQVRPCAAPVQPTKEVQMKKLMLTGALAMLDALAAIGEGSNKPSSVPKPKDKFVKNKHDREKLRAAAAKRERRAAKRAGKRK